MNIKANNAESKYSSFFENMAEHFLLAELLQEAWYNHGNLIDISRTEKDTAGTDIILELVNPNNSKRVLRHIQLKSAKYDSKKKQSINVELGNKPSGCVILMLRKEVLGKIELSYRFFGNKPGLPLPDLTKYKSSKGRRRVSGERVDRPNKKNIPFNQFSAIRDIAELYKKLFIE